jgi:DNA repair photolyase
VKRDPDFDPTDGDDLPGDAPFVRPPWRVRGRGAGANPGTRFDQLTVEHEEAPPDRIATRYLPDTARSVLSRNQSPDVPFDASVNPYRGCEHGCIYCYARPSHELLGLSAGLDFESVIFVKEDAPQLLREELRARSWKPQVLALSGVTDPYQPIERELRLTRGCLEVLAEARNPVGLISKNALVTRDIDILRQLVPHHAVSVALSITTLDPELARIMEPRASHPQRRLEAIGEMRAAGIPAGIMVAPIVPGLTDHEIPALLAAAAKVDATFCGYTILRLPGPVEGLFMDWLDRHFPDRKQKVLAQIRSMRGGRLNDPRFGSRMSGTGLFAEQITALFRLHQRKHGFGRNDVLGRLSADAFRRPADLKPGAQLSLLDLA